MTNSSNNDAVIQRLLEIMTNGENPDQMLQYLTDDCVWVLYPGGTEYRGMREITTFISTALASAGSRRKKKKKKPGSDVVITNWFANNDFLCLEYFHSLSFGGRLVRLFGGGSGIIMKHCNVYHMRDGKFDQVHEYAASSVWWLNLVAQMALGRIFRKTREKLNQGG